MTKAKPAAKAPRGRPPIPEEDRAVVGSIRLKQAIWDKLRELGAAWLEKQVKKARLPPPKGTK